MVRRKRTLCPSRVFWVGLLAILLGGAVVSPSWGDPAPEGVKQVLIEVKVWETSHRNQQQVDFDWTWLNLDRDGNPAGGALTGGRVNFNPKPTVGLSPLDVDVLRTSYGRLRMQLRAMTARGEAQVLATPVILTMDLQEAEIKTTDKIPIVQMDAGRLKTSSRDAGVLLKVTPEIMGDYVQMTVNVSVSLVTRYVRQADPSRENRIYEQPVIAERHVDTKLRVHSGEGIFLGGLVEESQQQTVKRVPIISRFPWMPEFTKNVPVVNTLWWVGRLFENRDTDLVRKELFIEIVPRILQPGEKVYWPTQILPEDRPRILDLYNMGLTNLLPQDDMLQEPQLKP